MQIIDTHVHFWNYHPVKDAWITSDMEVIQRDFLPNDFMATAEHTCVAIQADQSEQETAFLLDLAAQNDCIQGVVGWIDLKDKALPERLAHFAPFTKLKGFRHILQAEPDAFMLDEAFVQGVNTLGTAGYTYDILVYHRQLPTVLELLGRLDLAQPLILDHCAKPDIRTGDIATWANHIRTAAQAPNLYCKVSGLLTEADWKHWDEAHIFPYLDVVFEAFGPDRVVFGSDWPVMLLAGQYAQWQILLEKYTAHFSNESKIAFFAQNATIFYGL